MEIPLGASSKSQTWIPIRPPLSFIDKMMGVRVKNKAISNEYNNMNNLETLFPCKEELEFLVRGGVPKHLRGEIWQAFTGVQTRYVDKYYHNLVSSEMDPGNKKGQNGSINTNDHHVPEKIKKQIEKDLSRTFPGHPALTDDGRNSLRRILIAYARHNPSVGYCQAMNFFAGLFLLLMPEENAFWALVGIIDDYFDGYYTYEMIESVCTPQFVAMFTAVGGVGKAKRSCSAYISLSTRGLRSLLKEHDISFSMPLCSSKVEEISREDLVELSEIEKHNLGQAKRLMSMSDIDNSSQSLLSFHGNENVHNLYDFLLNYKSFLTTLAGLDVPILYSPIPFINASLSAPEIKCKELKTVEHYALQFESSTGKGQSVLDSSAGISYSIEVKGEHLPPWIVSSVCAAMVSSESSFEASFNTDLNTVGLNTVLKKSNLDSETEEHKDGGCGGSQASSNAYGIPDAIVSHDLHFAHVKSLKYCDGSYTVSLLPS